MTNHEAGFFIAILGILLIVGGILANILQNLSKKKYNETVMGTVVEYK